MKTVIGVYPTAFVLEEAVSYFKYKASTGFVDTGFEEIIRANFNNDEDYQDFIKKSLKRK